jgi:signal transduction histidine kinase
MSLAGTVSAPAGTAPAKPRARLKVPLAAKFAGAVVGLVVLVLAVNGAVNLWLSYGEAQRAALGVQEQQAQAASERIEQFVSEIESQIGWTTRAEWRRIGLEQQRYDFIRLLRQAPAITELFYIDSEGKEQLQVSRLEPDSVARLVDHSAEPRFTQAVASGTWFGPVTFRRGSEPYMTIAMAHAGRAPGVTVAEVNLKLIWDVVNEIRVGETGYAFVVGPAGKLIAHPDMSLVLRDTDMSGLPQVAAALASGEAEANTAAIAEGLDGDPVLSAYSPIPRLGWVVFVQSPVSEALAPVYALLSQSGILLAAGLLLATVVGTWLAGRMVVPIQRLQAGAERLGEGDLSQRIAIRTGDEIETLADRFNIMAARIQESHETLEAKVEERTRDLDEALQQQTATADVLKVISQSTFNLPAVLDALVQSAATLCGASYGGIFLRDGEVLRGRATISERPTDWEAGYPIEINRRWISGRVALSGLIEHIPDVLDDPDYDLAGLRLISDTRALMGVPLLRERKVEGVFFLGRPEPGAFTTRQSELVQTFADQAVIAIENVRLFEEVQARNRDLAEALDQQVATSAILRAIAASPTDIQPVLNTVTENAAQLCDAIDATLFLRRGEVLAVAAHDGAIPVDFTELPMARDVVTGRAVLDQSPVHVHDLVAAEDDFPAGRKYALRLGFRSILAMPLMREGEAIGALMIRRRDVRPFSDKQIDLLSTFADQAVIAIQNVRLFEEVQARTDELTRSLAELRTAQDRLVQTEKLASLGQLTAGIAHDIKNPLNFVNNFSALSGELLDELREALDAAALEEKLRAEVAELVGMLKGNLEKVVQHGRRADSIVKNMLLHSREGSGDHRPVDINAVVEESLNLAYHGARAEKQGFNITLERSLDPQAGEVDLFPQEITRVLLNLISNGFYATAKRGAQANGEPYEPTLLAATRDLGDRVEIRIRDNGTGIPPEVKDKMFNPFFTTKPAGEGTGLGLSLSHDIVVKQHAGTIEVATEPGAFTEFRIVLPRRGAAMAARTGDVA